MTESIFSKAALEMEEKGRTEDEMVGYITCLMDMNLSEPQELVMDREAWHTVVHGAKKSWTWLSKWTELNWGMELYSFRISNIWIDPVLKGREVNIAGRKYSTFSPVALITLERKLVPTKTTDLY